MLMVNREIDPEVVTESDAYLGEGCFGKVLAWGPSVFKIGAVSEQEAHNLNTARERIGGEVFPEAHLIRARSWADYDGVLMLDRVGGEPLTSLEDYTQADMWLWETRDVLRAYGIEHGDLHSGNVMITLEGMIRVIDGASLSFFEPRHYAYDYAALESW